MEMPKYVSKKSVLGSTAIQNNLLYCYQQVWQIFLLENLRKEIYVYEDFRGHAPINECCPKGRGSVQDRNHLWKNV